MKKKDDFNITQKFKKGQKELREEKFNAQKKKKKLYKKRERENGNKSYFRKSRLYIYKMK